MQEHLFVAEVKKSTALKRSSKGCTYLASLFPYKHTFLIASAHRLLFLNEFSSAYATFPSLTLPFTKASIYLVNLFKTRCIVRFDFKPDGIHRRKKD